MAVTHKRMAALPQRPIMILQMKMILQAFMTEQDLHVTANLWVAKVSSGNTCTSFSGQDHEDLL